MPTAPQLPESLIGSHSEHIHHTSIAVRYTKGMVIDGDAAASTTDRFEDGLKGNYDLDAVSVVKEAWRRSGGVKRIFLGAAILGAIYIYVMSYLLGVYRENFPLLLGSILLSIAYAPFLGGFVMMGARRAVDLPISLSTLFAYTSHTLPLAIVNIVITTVSWALENTLGLVLGSLLTSLLSIFTAMSIFLIADRGMGPIPALTASIQASLHRGWQLLSLFVLFMLMVMVSVITLGIGLIWAVPLISIAYGIVYREMFGVREALSAAGTNAAEQG